MRHRITAAFAIGFICFVAAPAPNANSVGADPRDPPIPAQPTQQPSNTKPKPVPQSNQPTGTQTPKPDNPNQPPKGSSGTFQNNYRAAQVMIYQRHKYEAGIVKLKSLGQDDHPDVANLIGYSNRKLGRYDDAKFWYEKALAADPNHARTWSYYGMWHAEQGNILKARDYLERVKLICGTGCREYTELKGVIEGTRLY